MDQNERSYTGEDGDLGQRIWNRYGRSPGLISTTATLGSVQRLMRLSSGRLPLLDAIQRRWMAPMRIFPGLD